MSEIAETTVLLIRHAYTDAVGQYLSGRTSGVHLSPAGKIQADRLGRALAVAPLAAIYTSPLERAVETARALTKYQVTPLCICDGLVEMDFGAWTGRAFAELAEDPEWQLYNRRRSQAVVPRGEQPLDAELRSVATVERLAAAHAGRTIALVTHAEIVRLAVLHYAGAPLDSHDRFEIAPASVTAVLLAGERRRLLYVNVTHGAASVASLA